MHQLDSTLRYRVRTLSCVLFLGGFIGIIDPIICWGVPPRTLLALMGGIVLWMILPYLNWTKDVRTSMRMAVAATFLVFQGCFVIYGDPFYIMLGFAVPVGAALFMSAFEASVILAVYCVTAIGISIIIWCGLWVPPNLVEGADLALNVKQTITGVSVIAAIAVSTIWKERLFAGPTARERIQQLRYETICDNGYDAILEANEFGHITFASGPLIQDLGFDSHQLIGRHHLEFICPGYRADFMRSTRMQNGVFKYDLETRVIDAEAQTHWVRISGGSFYDNTGKRKWVHGIRGIDDQVSQRERLFEISRLESLGSVCGGMAHDFNNLLTVIGIHADQINDSAIKQNILQAQSEATELTSGLLAFSRKQEYREQKIVLAEFLRKATPLVEKIVKENVQFIWQIDCKDSIVSMDPAQLQQILINLISNSDHAMPSGGNLVISAEKVDVLPDFVLDSLDHLTDYVVLKVADNGNGMSQEIKRRACEPFFTTKPRGKGTGLGLAMVHGIVKNSGGEISIASRPNDGTTVSLFLPLQSNAKSEVPSPHLSPSKRFDSVLSSNILLVEDRELVGKAIQHGLEIAGANVILFSTAEEAWEYLAAGGKFDVIVSDLVLPGMNGIELIEKAMQLNDETKAILMSGHQQQPIEFVRSQKNVRFLPKPFRAQQLHDLIKVHLYSVKK